MNNRFAFSLSAAFCCLVAFVPHCRAHEKQDALIRQANYIADCSYSLSATNHEGILPTSDAYGVINNVRIVDRGPDWVNQSTDAAMGLMAAAIQLKKDGVSTDRYNHVIQNHFQKWMLANRQPFDTVPTSPDYGAATSTVQYDDQGHFVKRGPVSSGSTAVAICSMWKYYEYLQATATMKESTAWLTAAWPLAKPGGEYIRRNVNHDYGLVATRSDFHDLWISESVFAVDAMQCLAAWSSALHSGSPETYLATSKELRSGIEKMRDDTGTWRNFYKFRSASEFTKPQYGDSVDQLCFAPYEFDALDPAEPFAKQISDWWTNGASGVTMTQVTGDDNDWRNYGVHWHYYFDKRAENGYLYPGPALQLAALEWKYWKATGDKTMLDRAKQRYQWVTSSEKSNLVYADANPDGKVTGGIVDWRDAADRSHTAPTWQRFSDTSAYFIYCTLMLDYNQDPKFGPQAQTLVKASL